MPLPPLIPREDFFANPVRASARLSPDGAQVAFLAPYEDRLNLWVRELSSGDERRLTADTTRSIRDLRWTRDGAGLLYHQDRGGDEQWRLHHVRVADGANRELTPFPEARALLTSLPFHDPGTAYFTCNERDPAAMDLWRLDLASGEHERVVSNDRGIRSYLLDRDGRLLAATAASADAPGNTDLLARDEGVWRLVASYPPMDFALLGVAPDGRGYAGSRAGDRDLMALVLIDLADGAQEVLAEDSEQRVDLGGPLLRPSTGELLAVSFVDDRVRYDARDEGVADVLARAQDSGAGDPVLTSFDERERRWTVVFTSDVDPGAAYLLDQEAPKPTLLYRPYPWLQPSALAPMTPIDLESRDGLRLPSYLTLPRDVPPEGLPLVVYVHGGPWARDTWGYDATTQFLANRGYAVLQVNYRGSSGFGRAFTDAAVGEFGKRMQDDLLDAVAWAVRRGHADPERVGIYGGSYGGYAALCGLTFAPEVFAAAVSLVGPSSLITLVRSFPPYWAPLLAGSWHRFVGDPDQPGVEERLRAVSPLYHSDQIRAPLLLVQGANDPRVTKLESDQMADALASRGVPVEYLLAEDEGHGISDPLTRQAVFRAMELFFAQHLGGRAEEQASPDVESRLAALRVEVSRT